MTEHTSRGYGAMSGMTYQCADGGDIHIPPASELDAGSQTAGVNAMTKNGGGVPPPPYG